MWRIILLAMGAFAIPYVLFWLEVGHLTILVVGMAYIALFCLYLDANVLNSLRALIALSNRIDSKMGLLPSFREESKVPSSANELENLVSSFHRICQELEARTSAIQVPAVDPGKKSGKNMRPPMPTDSSSSVAVENLSEEMKRQIHDEENDDDTVILRAIRGRAVFQCRLASGDPVVGEAVLMPQQPKLQPSTRKLSGSEAIHAFNQAVLQVREELEKIVDYPELSEADKGIIQFQVLLLQDKAILEGIQKCIEDGMNLAEALDTTFAVVVAKIEKSKNSYIAARAADCRDLQNRILNAILHQAGESPTVSFSHLRDKIVLAQQIYPSEVIWLYKAGVKGIFSVEGTPSSHAEILMQSFNIPSLSNPEPISIQMLKGRTLLLDTKKMRLIVDPNPEDIDEVLHQSSVDPTEVIREPVRLCDDANETVFIHATINNIEIEAPRAVEAGADGVGLFRSEMSFIGAVELPTEDELTANYTKLCQIFADKPIVMRMLDLGSDKLNGILGETREENPCMGNRSMRLLLKRPSIFRTQLRAMLRAIQNEQTTILFPMISGWHELEKIRTAIERIVDEFVREGNTIVSTVKFGIMVEVPSVALRFEDYVNEFDTFNIGTNDLTQYTLAADRNNEYVQEYYKPYHPSVLTLIQKVASLGNAASKKVCVCGEMAADPKMIPLLIGLGIRHLSVPY
ncbi:MAG: phosphoenolpyruvate--protein phosphotransferase, partial [Lentisphaerae bacterium]